MNLFKEFLLVGMGGFLGAGGRHLINVLAKVWFTQSTFPYGTFMVNMTGCLLIGFIAGFFDQKGWVGTSVRLFLIIGFLGGFTTYSSFINETFQMIRDNQLALAFLNISVKLVLGLILVALGYYLAKFT